LNKTDTCLDNLSNIRKAVLSGKSEEAKKISTLSIEVCKGTIFEDRLSSFPLKKKDLLLEDKKYEAPKPKLASVEDCQTFYNLGFEEAQEGGRLFNLGLKDQARSHLQISKRHFTNLVEKCKHTNLYEEGFNKLHDVKLVLTKF
jgi:hypothetical protein